MSFFYSMSRYPYFLPFEESYFIRKQKPSLMNIWIYSWILGPAFRLIIFLPMNLMTVTISVMKQSLNAQKTSHFGSYCEIFLSFLISSVLITFISTQDLLERCRTRSISVFETAWEAKAVAVIGCISDTEVSMFHQRHQITPAHQFRANNDFCIMLWVDFYWVPWGGNSMLWCYLLILF